MVRVDLQGLHVVKAKGKTYVYAWRGGPRIEGVPGTPAFMAAYNEAVEAYRMPDTGKFRWLVTKYKASPDFRKLADTTRLNWGRWLDIIADHFGDLSIRQFDRPEKIRPVIRRWRASYAATPRAADYGMQVLSRVLAYGVDPLGRLSSNAAEGIKHLYSVDRSAIIWTDADIAQLRPHASVEVNLAVELAGHVGLRASDLVRLSWSNVGEDAITISTGKSRHRREAIIPLYAALRDLLSRIPKRATTVLTNSRGRPWTASGLDSSLRPAMHKAKLNDRDLHFHDLRGTAATKFYLAGLTQRQIAEVMGWEEDQVERIIRRYVSRNAAIKDAIRQLDEARK